MIESWLKPENLQKLQSCSEVDSEIFMKIERFFKNADLLLREMGNCEPNVALFSTLILLEDSAKIIAQLRWRLENESAKVTTTTEVET